MAENSHDCTIHNSARIMVELESLQDCKSCATRPLLSRRRPRRQAPPRRSPSQSARCPLPSAAISTGQEAPDSMTNDLSVADDAGDLKTSPPNISCLVLAFLPRAGGRPSVHRRRGRCEGSESWREKQITTRVPGCSGRPGQGVRL